MSLLNLESLKLELPKFVDEAKLHFHAFGIGELLLDKPLAHVGITAGDESVFIEYRQLYTPLSTQNSEITSGGKRVAYYQLAEPLSLTEGINASILEITLAGPDEIITTEGMIDHITLYEPDIKTLLEKIEGAGLKPIIREYDDGSTVALEVNEYLQEVRFASFQKDLQLQ